MPKNTKSPYIGVFGHYGNQNLGDEAIIESVIQNIGMRRADTRIVCFSIRPDDTAIRYNLPAFPIRRQSISKNLKLEKSSNDSIINTNHDEKFNGVVPEHLKNNHSRTDFLPKYIAKFAKLPKRILNALRPIFEEPRFLYDSYLRLRKIDLLLICGSNQFLDNFGGPLGFPLTLLKWSILSKLAGVKICFVSVGAGPIAKKMSKRLIKFALLFSDYTSLRDNASQRLIQSCGHRKKTCVYPDLAHSLALDHIRPRRINASENPGSLPIVGINPMPLYDQRYWCIHDKEKYSSYVKKLTEFASLLLKNKYPMFFFGTQVKDYNVINDIVTQIDPLLLSDIHSKDLVLYSKTVDQLMSNFAAADIIVATRFHGTVLALRSEKPLIGICYYRKARDLMKQMEQGEYAVDLDKFTIDDLWSRFKKLEMNRHQEVVKIKKKNSEYIDALNTQYDILLNRAFL